MLTRFRADPSKVRVSIRPIGKEWCVTVRGTIEGEPGVLLTTGRTPKTSLLHALRRAQFYMFDGIDLKMGRTYAPPMKGE